MTEDQIIKMRELVANLIGPIHETLPISLENETNAVFSEVCYSRPSVGRDEEISIIANDILGEEDEF